MAYDTYLEERLDRLFNERGVVFQSKKMIGGLCYMVDDKMCVGVIGDRLMARIGEDAATLAIGKPGCSPMDFTGRPLKGYVYVDDVAIDSDAELAHWLDLALAFNPRAKASKRRKKKK